ncbi:MAG: NAD(P)H-dependent glycerol-3-phosphate dehydrogenase [Litoreibacter sp.]
MIKPKIVIAGAGAFGTALALTQCREGRDVTLVGRNLNALKNGENPKLPGLPLPPTLTISDQLEVSPQDILLMCIPMQQLTPYLSGRTISPRAAIACCKGIDLVTGRGPTDILRDHIDAPATTPVGILTGPSFATDIGRGLPTALALALPNGASVQRALSTDTLRLYLTDDVTGAEIGGALKNVIAIACGICIGAGFGESARAALMTRGFTEMSRLALALGARAETLAGLSGFGDLALTCTSTQSRNFTFGHALGRGDTLPNTTVEGRATAHATADLAAKHGLEMPIAKVVADVIDGKQTVQQALTDLLSRPLTKE